MIDEHLSQGCLVPALQALASGVLTGVTILAVVLWWNNQNAGYLALAGGAATALVWYFGSIRSWRRSTFGPDQPLPIIDDPGHDGQPQMIRVELVTDAGRHREYIDLPASRSQLRQLASGVLAGSPMSEASWVGGRGIFSRSQFSQLRDELIKRGLLRWNNSHTTARGAALTAQGKAVFRYLSTLPALPDDDDA